MNFEIKLKRLYALKMEIQRLESENTANKEKWRKLSVSIRSNSQMINQKTKALLDAI